MNFDELPQHHMLEVQRAQENYETLATFDDQLTRVTSTSRVKVDSDDRWMSSPPALSPLERFYHTYISHYDKREEAPLSKRVKGRAKKKARRKLSTDNTISSLDSLICDDTQLRKADSNQSDALPKEESKEATVDKTDTTLRELTMENKSLLGKDWESSEQTSRSEPVHSYVRHEEMNAERVDLFDPVDPASSGQNKTDKQSIAFLDNATNLDFTLLENCMRDHSELQFKDSQFTVHVGPECIRISDQNEHLNVNGKPSQVIILGDFKVPSHGTAFVEDLKVPSFGTSFGGKRRASEPLPSCSSQVPGAESEFKRSPMRIKGDHVYINIGGENTQIKRYNDYGTVKISGRKSKKIAEAAEKAKKKKKKKALKTSAAAEKREKRKKKKRMKFTDHEKEISNSNLGEAELSPASSGQDLDQENEFTARNPGQAYDHSSPSIEMSESLDTLTTAQIYSALKDHADQDSLALPEQQNEACCYVIDSEPPSGVFLPDNLEILNGSGRRLENILTNNDSGIQAEHLDQDGRPRIAEVTTSRSSEAEVNSPTGLTPMRPKRTETASDVCFPVAADTSAGLSKEDEIIDETGLVNIYALKNDLNRKNHHLKKSITRFREKTEKLARLHSYMEQLKLETAEMRRLLCGVDRQTEALRCEAAEMRCTVTAICDLSVATIGKETEARRLEPACYRRYLNIRTAADASSALTAVRSRIKALNDLEVLIYRKQLVLHHVLPTLTQEKTAPPKRVNRPAHKGTKSKRNDEVCETPGAGHIVIEVVSPVQELHTPSLSEDVSHTESPLTSSTPMSGSNDGTVSTPMLPDTEV
nr:histone H3.v1-like isoform X1 [Biomphalaria glabrata]